MLIDQAFDANGLATRRQLLAMMNAKTLARRVAVGDVVRVWHGVYAQTQPDLLGRLFALDLLADEPIVACLHTAATLYGFGTEDTSRVHILDPGVRMRPKVKSRDVVYDVVV